jgi:hypothetical protein
VGDDEPILTDRVACNAATAPALITLPDFTIDSALTSDDARTASRSGVSTVNGTPSLP